MKIFILLTLFFFTLNCSINKVSNLHGFRFIDTKYKDIKINKTNKNDVRKIIGPPSSISKFNDVWFYIERKKQIKVCLNLEKKNWQRIIS